LSIRGSRLNFQSVKNLLPILPAFIFSVGCQPADDQTVSAPPPPFEAVSERGIVPPAGVFENVAAELGKGGVFYSIIDIEGSARRTGQFANRLLALANDEMPFLDLSEIDIAKVFDTLGLTAVAGMGLSSERHEMGFLNRGFLYTPSGREGLLHIAGGDPRPFSLPTLAPADADLVFEFDLNPRALFETLQQLSSQIAGDIGSAGLSGATMAPVFPGAPISFFDLLTGNPDLRIGGFLRGENWWEMMEAAEPVDALGDIELYLRIEGYADLLADLRDHLENTGWHWNESDQGYRLTLKDEASPAVGVQIVGTLPGNIVEFFLNPATEAQVRSSTPRLANHTVYLNLMRHLEAEGNLLLYQSPAYLQNMVRGLSQEADEDKTAAALVSLIEGIFGSSLIHGTALTASNRPDGIAIREISPLSYRSQIVLAPVAYNAALIGAFFGWQQSMQHPYHAYEELDLEPWDQHSEPENQVLFNLHLIHSMGMQEMIERDRTSIRFDEFPEEVRSQIHPVAGESYVDLEIRWDGGRLEVSLPDGTVVGMDY